MINMAAASFLSTNTLDYCYTFRQKVLLRNSSLSPWRFLTGVAMEYVLRYASASPSGTASASDLVSPRFPRLLLHGNFLSQTLCGYAFKTHISSSPNRSDSFFVWKRWHIFKRFLSLLRLELIASMFFSDAALPDSGVFSGTSVFYRSAPTSTKRASSNS